MEKEKIFFTLIYSIIICNKNNKVNFFLPNKLIENFAISF